MRGVKSIEYLEGTRLLIEHGFIKEIFKGKYIYIYINQHKSSSYNYIRISMAISRVVELDL